MSDIREAVRQFLLANFLPGEDSRNLTDQTDLKTSGILDSLSTLRLVAFLEEKFVIELAPDDLEPHNLATVEAIAGLVQGKRGA
jgi:acyl carrier protein